TSGSFPVSAGAIQTVYGGGTFDAFVSKLNASGASLVYSTYLGGSGSEEGFGIAADTSGNAYVTGSTSASFPTTAGALQTTPGGSSGSAFVSKLNASGTSFAYSTYLGGSGSDRGNGIAVDSSGNAYVVGSTTTGFRTTSGAFQSTFGGGPSDAFVS